MIMTNDAPMQSRNTTPDGYLYRLLGRCNACVAEGGPNVPRSGYIYKVPEGKMCSNAHCDWENAKNTPAGGNYYVLVALAIEGIMCAPSGK